MREKKGKIAFFLIAATDQLLKFIALKKNLSFVNEGISLGILGGFPFNKALLVLLPVLLALFLFFSVVRFPKSISLALILSGGLSNYIDRVIRGGVVDYVKILPFPLFNLADAAIVLGTAWFLVDLIKKETVS